MHQKREKDPVAPQQNDPSPSRDDELSHAGGKEHEVESQENEEGTDIEVEEANLPSPAAAVHEEIRQEGEKELERDSLALGWSALAAGLSMGASLMAKGIFHARLPEGAVGVFVENLGDTIGFVIVIMARQQLFTENTLTAVLPFMHKPTRHNFAILMRLWGVVLVGNLIGTALMAFAFIHLPVFDSATRAAFVTLSQEVMANTPGEMFCNAIISGWIIASLVWMMPAAKHNKLLIIILMTDLMGIGNLTHSVVGSVEILYLVFNGDIPWWQFFYPFALPTLAGNIVGGTFIFALISHAQIRNDLSHHRRTSAASGTKTASAKQD